MKITKAILIILIVLLFIPSVEARRKSKTDYFLRPQAGLWFGPITPLHTTNDEVDTNLGGGLFFRYNTPFRLLKIGIDGSYQFFDSKGVNTLSLWPIYGNFLYRIPLPTRFPLTFQLKAGAGGSYIKIRPDRVTQWDPLGMVGLEMSFPAGKIVNIGLRIDYLLLYEKHISGATKNGHILNTGITLFFNI